jgi:hypothetical protein
MFEDAVLAYARRLLQFRFSEVGLDCLLHFGDQRANRIGDSPSCNRHQAFTTPIHKIRGHKAGYYRCQEDEPSHRTLSFKLCVTHHVPPISRPLSCRMQILRARNRKIGCERSELTSSLTAILMLHNRNWGLTCSVDQHGVAGHILRRICVRPLLPVGTTPPGIVTMSRWYSFE